MPALKNEPMSRHTSFKIGGPCPLLLLPQDAAQLTEAVALLRARQLPFFVMGKGSNLLVSDAGTDKIILKIDDNFATIGRVEDTGLEASAGLSLARLAGFARDHALAGLAFAAGIPGTVGGGLFMNAGAYGGELCGLVQEVVCLTAQNEIVTMENAACEFGYRSSFFSKNTDVIILSARFLLSRGDRAQIDAEMAELARRRRESQPLTFPSAGSTFKRPPGGFAGTLIDQAGLKGYSIGGAQVSAKHAGFIVNTGGATAADVQALICHVQETVFEKSGMRLEPEVRFLD